MRVDDRVRRELIKNLKAEFTMFSNEFKRIINSMSRVSTVEKLMRLKKKLLITWLYFMPIDRHTCYFCIKDEMEEKDYLDVCKSCEYGKIHGCCVREGSDYDKIMKELGRLMAKIERLYVRRGERYD